MSTAARKALVGPAVGRAIRRKEDPRLITGRGAYVEDMVLPGMLHAAIVRSPEAHARIVSVDGDAARARPGVHAVLTAEDLDFSRPLPMIWHPPGVEMRTPDHWPLAREAVKHVGDPVAVIVADDRYAVVDAAEDVLVEYEPLPAVVDPEAALKPGSPLVWEQFGTNRSHEWSLGSDDIDPALAKADVTVERRIVNHRTAGAAIEPRGVLADWHAERLSLWTSTQIPHLVRRFLAGELGIPEDDIRVIAPDVGGGFGSKLNHYGEETLMSAVARMLGRPVKWIETRSENLQATTHGRDLLAYARLGLMRDGTITALHVRLIADLGAYQQIMTPFMPSFAAYVMGGCYRIPAVRTDTVGVFTNKVALDSVRGAGRPEATHLIEVMIEQAAAELGIDRLELRRRNFIPKDAFPASMATGLVYDSGDYHRALDKLVERIDVAAFELEQAQLRDQGVYRGIGFSAYVENSGLAPSRLMGPHGAGFEVGFWESATVRVHPTGSATVFTGTSAHGQGHETSFAQIVADRLGLDPEDVAVIHGDTDTGPAGMGTYGSRSLCVGGEAAGRAADKVADKAKRLAAHLLEASPADIEIADGDYRFRGSAQAGVSLREIAAAAYVSDSLPEGLEPGLEETQFYDPSNFTWPFGAHAAVVEVHPQTGKVRLLRFVAVDDCGRVINPLLVEGQVHGGIAHAVGQALFEQIVYDAGGQLVTGTFVDYGLPTAAELPSFETERTETPSPVNKLGAKGTGESGTIGATPAVLNAVIDALRPLGVTYIDMPLSPLRVWQAIEAAGGMTGAPR